MDTNTLPTQEQSTATQTPLESHRAAAEAKAAELTAKHGRRVIPIIFYREGDAENMADPVIGFLKEPERLTKQRIIDEGSRRGEMEVAGDLLGIALIKEESDYRLSSDNQEFDDVYFGACVAASQQIIRVAINQYKKK